MSQDPGADADRPTSALPVSFRAYWQNFHLVIENNVFDCYRTDGNSVTFARGVSLYAYEQVPPYISPQVLIRENIVRHTDHAASSTAHDGISSVGLGIDSTENGIAEQNIIDFEHPNPLWRLHSKNVRFFNNTTASGTLIRGHEITSPDPSQKDDELATLIEDAMLLAI
jgi:hypothetical protein